jgi:hypothetical protein
MTVLPPTPRPPAWEVLAQALRERRPVRARYHGADRLLCPHVLGWKNRRAKLLAYQVAGGTSDGPLPSEAQQRWRSMFVDEIENAVCTEEPWATADNYSPDTNAIDQVEFAIAP